MQPPTPRGLVRNEPGAQPGYTMIAPLNGKTVYLIDLSGNVVHCWNTSYSAGSDYLLQNGNLLRCSRENKVPRLRGGGVCGRLQEIAWDGSIVWDWAYMSDKYVQHHDLTITPKGTVLFIAWEYKTRSEAVQAGRDPKNLTKEGLWPDSVIEVRPSGATGAEIIWEWHAWDHLIQDRDPELKNYGDPAQHPELIDINADLERPHASDADTEKLKQLGYVGATPSRGAKNADWLHTNSIDYNAERDEIMLSVAHLGEIWIIDHSTTMAQAAGHSGGRAGRGGDLLYRWGNPKNYRAGSDADRQLYYQHHAHWIQKGLPGAGHVLVFNNGTKRGEVEYSSVLELVLPIGHQGEYVRLDHGRYGPTAPEWQYTAPDKKSFFSPIVSGAQRLQNGNTLICEGASGRVFEVTREGAVVWEYSLWALVSGVRSSARPPAFSPPRDTNATRPNATQQGQPAQGANQMPQGALPQALFRATRIGHDHPALAGKDLKPKS